MIKYCVDEHFLIFLLIFAKPNDKRKGRLIMIFMPRNKNQYGDTRFQKDSSDILTIQVDHHSLDFGVHVVSAQTNTLPFPLCKFEPLTYGLDGGMTVYI